MTNINKPGTKLYAVPITDTGEPFLRVAKMIEEAFGDVRRGRFPDPTLLAANLIISYIGAHTMVGEVPAPEEGLDDSELDSVIVSDLTSAWVGVRNARDQINEAAISLTAAMEVIDNSQHKLADGLIDPDYYLDLIPG